MYAPLCPLAIGSLLLTGVIYARTRPVMEPARKPEAAND